MKHIRKILAPLTVLLLLATAISCSNDDGPSGTKVRYKVMTSGDILTSISFRGRDGELIGVPISSVSNEWGKTIFVQPPFNADLTVGFDNQTDASQDYTLTIYVDDVIVETVPGTVSAGITTSAFATHVVE